MQMTCKFLLQSKSKSISSKVIWIFHGDFLYYFGILKWNFPVAQCHFVLVTGILYSYLTLTLCYSFSPPPLSVSPLIRNSNLFYGVSYCFFVLKCMQIFRCDSLESETKMQFHKIYMFLALLGKPVKRLVKRTFNFLCFYW